MPELNQYAFNMTVRITVKAEDANKARNSLARFDDMREIDDEYRMTGVIEIESVRACIVCGCTESQACQPNSCGWLTWDVCSTADVPHLEALQIANERAAALEAAP